MQVVLECWARTEEDRENGVPRSGNRNVFCIPCGQTLRGRWRNSDTVLGVSQDLGALPDMPGQCIRLDVKSSTVTIFDPLGDSPNFDAIAAAWKKLGDSIGTSGGTSRPERELRFPNRSAEQMREWIVWAHAALNAKMLVVQSGQMPPLPDNPNDPPQPASDPLGADKSQRPEDTARTSAKDQKPQK